MQGHRPGVWLRPHFESSNSKWRPGARTVALQGHKSWDSPYTAKAFLEYYSTMFHSTDMLNNPLKIQRFDYLI